MTSSPSNHQQKRVISIKDGAMTPAPGIVSQLLGLATRRNSSQRKWHSALSSASETIADAINVRVLDEAIQGCPDCESSHQETLC